jgi:hypothetical protein
MRYKTLNESTAHALVRHWATLAISCQVSTTDAPHFYEVVTIPGDLPMNDDNAPAVVTFGGRFVMPSLPEGYPSPTSHETLPQHR